MTRIKRPRRTVHDVKHALLGWPFNDPAKCAEQTDALRIELRAFGKIHDDDTVSYGTVKKYMLHLTRGNHLARSSALSNVSQLFPAEL